MMRILLFLMIFLPVSLKAQQTNADTSKIIRNFAFSDVSKKGAVKDIRELRVKLLLIGGEVPVIYTGQNNFEIKFDILYLDFGCITPKRDSVKAYNKQIFKYLDKKYGNVWRKEVRPDVVGL